MQRQRSEKHLGEVVKEIHFGIGAEICSQFSSLSLSIFPSMIGIITHLHRVIVKMKRDDTYKVR